MIALANEKKETYYIMYTVFGIYRRQRNHSGEEDLVKTRHGEELCHLGLEREFIAQTPSEAVLHHDHCNLWNARCESTLNCILSQILFSLIFAATIEDRQQGILNFSH